MKKVRSRKTKELAQVTLLVGGKLALKSTGRLLGRRHMSRSPVATAVLVGFSGGDRSGLRTVQAVRGAACWF